MSQLLISISPGMDEPTIFDKITSITKMHVTVFSSPPPAKVFIVLDLIAEASSDRDAS